MKRKKLKLVEVAVDRWRWRRLKIENDPMVKRVEWNGLVEHVLVEGEILMNFGEFGGIFEFLKFENLAPFLQKLVKIVGKIGKNPIKCLKIAKTRFRWRKHFWRFLGIFSELISIYQNFKFKFGAILLKKSIKIALKIGKNPIKCLK